MSCAHVERTAEGRCAECGLELAEAWRAETWAEFRDASPEDVSYLVEGLWPTGSLGFIAAPPKRGKTWVALGMAVAIASGSPLFGEYPIADGPRTVLYIALEGARPGLRARIGAIARGMGLDPDGDDLARLHVLYRPRPFNLADPELAALVIAEARRLGAAVVFVDVLRQATRGTKEASSEDFATVRDAIEPLVGEGRSVALLHHFGKLNETQKERTPGERMAGSGAMEGALDVAFYIVRSEAGARRLRVEFEARDFATPDAIGVAITGTGTGTHGGFRYTDSAAFVLDPTAAEGRDLVAELAELFTDGAWRTVDEARKALGANKDEVRDALEASPERFVEVDPKRVDRHPNARPWGTIAMLESLAQTPEPHEPDKGVSDLQTTTEYVWLPVGERHTSHTYSETVSSGSEPEPHVFDSDASANGAPLVAECLTCGVALENRDALRCSSCSSGGTATPSQDELDARADAWALDDEAAT